MLRSGGTPVTYAEKEPYHVRAGRENVPRRRWRRPRSTVLPRRLQRRAIRRPDEPSLSLRLPRRLPGRPPSMTKQASIRCWCWLPKRPRNLLRNSDAAIAGWVAHGRLRPERCRRCCMDFEVNSHVFSLPGWQLALMRSAAIPKIRHAYLAILSGAYAQQRRGRNFVLFVACR